VKISKDLSKYGAKLKVAEAREFLLPPSITPNAKTFTDYEQALRAFTQSLRHKRLVFSIWRTAQKQGGERRQNELSRFWCIVILLQSGFAVFLYKSFFMVYP